MQIESFVQGVIVGEVDVIKQMDRIVQIILFISVKVNGLTHGVSIGKIDVVQCVNGIIQIKTVVAIQIPYEEGRPFSAAHIAIKVCIIGEGMGHGSSSPAKVTKLVAVACILMRDGSPLPAEIAIGIAFVLVNVSQGDPFCSAKITGAVAGAGVLVRTVIRDARERSGESKGRG